MNLVNAKDQWGGMQEQEMGSSHHVLNHAHHAMWNYIEVHFWLLSYVSRCAQDCDVHIRQDAWSNFLINKQFDISTKTFQVNFTIKILTQDIKYLPWKENDVPSEMKPVANVDLSFGVSVQMPRLGKKNG